MTSSLGNNRGPNAQGAIDVVPLTLHIGAEIRGVDLTKPLPPETLREVRDAFLKWKVVFFRDSISTMHSTSLWRGSSASRRSAMPFSALSTGIPRSTRSPKTAPPTRTAKRCR